MSPPRLSGLCRVLYCFDVARTIDLVRAESVLGTARRTNFHHKGGFPAEAGVAAPVRFSWKAPSSAASELQTAEDVEIALYDFGAVAITWTLAIDHALDDLVELSGALYANTELTERSRVVALDVVRELHEACDQPGLHRLVEDYVVFELEPPVSDVEAWSLEHRGTLAQVLRAEAERLSEQEVRDALDTPISYGVRDLALVDWLGAILVGHETDDERLLLELATVELLELRLLDDRLDEETEAAYRLLTAPRTTLGAWTSLRRELERIGRTEADDALLHQGIDNALKLFGDDYLARLYRAASRRFHFDDWDSAIARKLGTLHSIYGSLADQAAHRRSEILEWIIIVLIAVDIVIYFV
ncbi:hypothetical protein Pla163_03680 [Planctomycetes bacterium Pla163]|uniref:DUF155 domain-containing protein n=1 Tax=Rohdeia mirabilis TaxID=2528008 RepID=A0A518CVN1_9BACT|nr:hypothetical protein Pla163_03680 [Planctomycetes bacterium Pla163]